MTSKVWFRRARSRQAVRARLDLLAAERPLIRSVEVQRALKSDKAMLAFARRHELSLD
jgi:hypothetical protein